MSLRLGLISFVVVNEIGLSLSGATTESLSSHSHPVETG
jgi:hypothetical protein